MIIFNVHPWPWRALAVDSGHYVFDNNGNHVTITVGALSAVVGLRAERDAALLRVVALEAAIESALSATCDGYLIELLDGALDCAPRAAP